MSPKNLSRIVHDMRTRLALISGYAEVLRRRRDADVLRTAPVQILRATQELSAALDELVAPTIDPRLQEDALAAAGAAGRRRRRIVVADDDVLIRRLLHTTLPAADFDVIEAGDGGECLAAVEQGETDLVVLDWLMPRLDGAATLRRLKATNPDLPVIVLTGAASRVRAAVREQADAVLVKPFSPIDLIETIDSLLLERDREPMTRRRG